MRSNQQGFWLLGESKDPDWSVAVFTTSLESQESYLTLRNVTLQTRLSITPDFFRQHSTFARLYNAAASPASRLRSAGSLAMNKGRGLTCYQRDAGPGSPSLTEFDCRVNFLLCSFYISSAAEHVLFFSFV